MLRLGSWVEVNTDDYPPRALGRGWALGMITDMGISSDGRLFVWVSLEAGVVYEVYPWGLTLFSESLRPPTGPVPPTAPLPLVPSDDGYHDCRKVNVDD